MANNTDSIKKAAFGGFNKKQVLEYIDILQEKCNENKLIADIDAEKAKYQELLKILDFKNYQLNMLRSKVKKLKHEIELSETDKNNQGALSKSDAQIVKARKTAKQIAGNVGVNEDNIDNLLDHLASISDEVEQISDSLSDIYRQYDSVAVKAEAKLESEYEKLTSISNESSVQQIPDENIKQIDESQAANIENTAETHEIDNFDNNVSENSPDIQNTEINNQDNEISTPDLNEEKNTDSTSEVNETQPSAVVEKEEETSSSTTDNSDENKPDTPVPQSKDSDDTEKTNSSGKVYFTLDF